MDSLSKENLFDWEKIESEEHDGLYKKSLPFDCKSYKIDPVHIIWWEDYCYKKGRRKDRGNRTKRVFQLINLQEIKGKKILDVGCGNGQYSVFFALMGAEVYGFDISPIGISVAKKMAELNHVNNRCHFSVQNASKMNFLDNFFDIVLYHEVLHHAIKYQGVKEETFRIVKKGGMVICAESLDGNFLFRIARFFTMRGKEAMGDVMLTIPLLKNFVEGYTEYQIELTSLVFMSKRFFINWLWFPPIRWFLCLAKKTDDVLLLSVPFLRQYCGECILIAKK